LRNAEQWETKKLLIIPAMKNKESENGEDMIERNHEKVMNTPLTLEVVCLVSQAIKHLPDPDTKQCVSNVVLNMAKEFENPVLQSSLGLFNFQRNVNRVLENVSSKREDAEKLSAERSCIMKRQLNNARVAKRIR